MEVSVECKQCKNACSATHYQNKTKKICSGNGELKCGACECDKNFLGKNCECDANKNKEDLCIWKENGEVCNSHGTCECGKCICNPDYLGKFCQHSEKEHCSLDGGKLVEKIFNILYLPAIYVHCAMKWRVSTGDHVVTDPLSIVQRTPPWEEG